jgi:hypothetical protein
MSRVHRAHPGRLQLPALLLMLTAAPVSAQIDTEPTSGLSENTPRYYALTGARVIAGPGDSFATATVILRDGLIVAVGEGLEPPEGAQVLELDGHVIYPGFVDAMAEVGLPAGLRTPRPRGPDAGPPPPPPTQAANGFWNSRIQPETDVATLLAIDADETEALRGVGITTALAVPRRGILRGQSAAVNLGDYETAGRQLLAVGIAQHAGAETGGRDEYPSSLMGAIALLRQALYDGDWYAQMQAYSANNPAVERAADNAALAALGPLLTRTQPLFYAADDELDYARARMIADEFDLELVLYGNGHEYRKTGVAASLIVLSSVPGTSPMRAAS